MNMCCVASERAPFLSVLPSQDKPLYTVNIPAVTHRRGWPALRSQQIPQHCDILVFKGIGIQRIWVVILHVVACLFCQVHTANACVALCAEQDHYRYNAPSGE